MGPKFKELLRVHHQTKAYDLLIIKLNHYQAYGVLAAQYYWLVPEKLHIGMKIITPCHPMCTTISLFILPLFFTVQVYQHQLSV